jgi:hypothetical protein
MPSLQKAIHIRFKEKIPFCAPYEMIQLLNEKCEEFFYKDKTDLDLTFIDEYTTQRLFVDQESVEEWAKIMQAEADKNNVEIAEIKIFDI